jgi:hypothetical protein
VIGLFGAMVYLLALSNDSRQVLLHEGTIPRLGCAPMPRGE